MLNISNLLSLSRAGLAFFFLQSNPYIRLAVIIVAMITDFLDGYVARRSRTSTRFGALLDPLMDKFFVLFAGIVFLIEGNLPVFGLIALLSRDMALCLFGLFLGLAKGLKEYEYKAIWWGKMTTVAQFIVLIGLTLNFVFPFYVYWLFIVMAVFAFMELLVRYLRISRE